MKTFSKEEMLEILNKYLGYGNPDATIYFIGLEEKVRGRFKKFYRKIILKEFKSVFGLNKMLIWELLRKSNG